MCPPRPHAAGALSSRAFTAIALTIGFYALAFTIVSVLLYIPYAEAKYAHEEQPQLLVLWLAAAAILWSIVPRPDRFEVPGALLTAASEPRLFAIIDHVAQATGQPRPAEVYLVRDVNAWVSSRGGWMGIGGRPIMGIGLPLLERLTISELQGVLAHEFGHYCGGDVKLGPWIYKTRAAIGRAVALLAGSGSGALYIVHKPFVWYGKFFLEFTQAISRRQELDADRLAARVAGGDVFASGLRAVHALSGPFEAYWRGVVVPVLTAGYRPPLGAGFSLFCSAPKLAEKMESFAAEASKIAKADPYDTHPSLSERLAQLEDMHQAGELPAPLRPTDGRFAVQLLSDIGRAEADVLSTVAADPSLVASMRAIEWKAVGERVSLERWRRGTGDVSAVLGPMTPAMAPTDGAGLEALGLGLLGPRARRATREILAGHAATVIAAAVACMLVRQGWSIEAMPGEPVKLRRGDTELRPFSIMLGLARGKTQPDEWRALHIAGGISELPLATGGSP
jgi:heat shock protein HtpX